MSGEAWPEFVIADTLRKHPGIPLMQQASHIAIALRDAGYQFVIDTPESSSHLPFISWPGDAIAKVRDMCHETGRFQYWKNPQWRKPRELACDILAALGASDD